jgi:hypothetical protein
MNIPSIAFRRSAFETASGVPGVLLGGVDGMHWPTIPKASY